MKTEKKIETQRQIVDVDFDGIDHSDAPDYSDSHIISASWKDTGKELTEDEIESLDGIYVYELLMNHIH